MKRLIVLVRTGPLRGAKTCLSRGSRLTIGRREPCDLTLPGDMQMSARHAEIAWDGSSCRIRDLESLSGTWVNGERVAEAPVEHGSYVRLGDTMFSVYVEGATPPRKKHTSISDAARRAREQALSILRAERDPLFAVLDAARDPRILELLCAAPEPFESLYEGVQGEALAEVAPYLVRLDSASPLLASLVSEGWSDAWGVFLTWPSRPRDLRRHLRRFLMVKDAETGQLMYFRFYDPRVLRDFLPLTTAQQTEDLFGEIGSFLVEGEKGDVWRFAPGRASPCT